MAKGGTTQRRSLANPDESPRESASQVDGRIHRARSGGRDGHPLPLPRANGVRRVNGLAGPQSGSGRPDCSAVVTRGRLADRSGKASGAWCQSDGTELAMLEERGAKRRFKSPLVAAAGEREAGLRRLYQGNRSENRQCEDPATPETRVWRPGQTVRDGEWEARGMQTRISSSRMGEPK